ncbi:unknown_gene_8393 [Phodopus roborovskii]|uniref:Solute carrier organic anion transporter family member n=1 Tax=Phodopus roborovskii TaxID=109678 RepID=A0AAV0A9J6_PHORO|nr:unknown_gene_8393 [Phodopus roborovskii]
MGEPRKRVAAHGVRCFSKIKMFLVALTGAYVSKSLSGAYMNSMLTQIERQFNIPTSIVGFINGSFEIGNLVLIIFVSYFGTKLHRPIMIGIGCVVMGLGCFLMSLPHFLMGRYEYEKTISPASNLSSNSFLCSGNRTSVPTPDPAVYKQLSFINKYYKTNKKLGMLLHVWLYTIRYIRILETGKILGPLLGLFLASFCATIYVDTGSVKTDDLTITPTDTRWVGAWWVGFLICAGVNILTSTPFFFIPKTLPREGLEGNVDVTKRDKEEKHQGRATEEKRGLTKGLYSLPPICMGYLLGGFIMKKFTITVKKAAYIAFCLCLIEYLLSFFNYMWTCDNFPVAGLTTSYEGIQQSLYVENKVLDDCNTKCDCLTKTWDPVCGDNGLAYMSACLAGCEKSVGTGINMVFQNCSCIRSSGNSSAVLGLCKKGPDCTVNLQYYLIMSIFGCFIYSLSAIPGYMVLLRCTKSEEKSLGVGLQAFCIRVFAGIPAPIYFGALIDRTCLYWGTQKCGERGACRLYDIHNFRRIYLGLPAALRGSSFLPAFLIVLLIRKLQLPGESDSPEQELAEMKLTEKERECMIVHRSPEFENKREQKTKL